MEQAIVLTTNDIRAAHGKPRLKTNDQLSQLARAYSQLMLAENFLGHVAPSGKMLSNRFADSQIQCRATAENLDRHEGVFQTIPTHAIV